LVNTSPNDLSPVRAFTALGYSSTNPALTRDTAGLESFTRAEPPILGLNVNSTVTPPERRRLHQPIPAHPRGYQRHPQGGGAGGSNLTLNSNGASFASNTGGTPVTGIADGANPFDAVNVRQLQAESNQLQAVSTGVASIAAMSNIPGLDATKTFKIGIGYGNFQGNSALAIGVNGRLAPSVSAKASVGFPLSYGNASAGVGLAYSF